MRLEDFGLRIRVASIRREADTAIARNRWAKGPQCKGVETGNITREERGGTCYRGNVLQRSAAH